MNQLKNISLQAMTLILLCQSGALMAADKLGPMISMTGLYNAEFVDVYSDTIDDTYRIFVASPLFVEPEKTYPVIYVLDANGTFGMVMETARLLAFTEEIPPAYIVGIGYAVDFGLAGALSKRYRDLTPTEGGELEELTRQMSSGNEIVMPGGGPLFLEFLTQPDSFQRYIIISPSIWWNQEEVWQWEEAAAGQHKDRPCSSQPEGYAESTGRWLAENPPENLPLPAIQRLHDASYGWPAHGDITPEFVAGRYPSLEIDVPTCPTRHTCQSDPAPGRVDCATSSAIGGLESPRP